MNTIHQPDRLPSEDEQLYQQISRPIEQSSAQVASQFDQAVAESYSHISKIIAPSNRFVSTTLSTIRTLGLAIAVAVLFALWLIGKLVILVAALVVMAFDMPAPTSRLAVTKISVSEPSPSAPKVNSGFDYGLVADPW